MKNKILYISVHEVLEYDEIRILNLAGFKVFSIGAFTWRERGGGTPLRPTRPEFFSEEDFKAMAEGGVRTVDGKMILSKDFVQRFDACIVMHQHRAIMDNIETLKDTLVIRRTIGQTWLESEKLLSPYRNFFKVVRQSPNENREGFAEPDAVIRFGKFRSDFEKKWAGGGDRLLTFMSTARRATARPSIADYLRLIEGMDADLYGMDNSDAPNWRGVADTQTQHALYAGCRAYLYIHSLIASYTLNFMEAMLTGCPIVAPDAAYVTKGDVQASWSQSMYEVEDILGDGAGYCYGSIEDARLFLKNASLNDLGEISARAHEKAWRLFDANVIAAQWRKFIEANV